MQPIQYQGKITRVDISNALNLHYKSFHWLKWATIPFIVLLLISMLPFDFSKPDVISYFLPGLLFPLAFLSMPWWFIPQQTAAFEKTNIVYRNPIHGEVNELGFALVEQAMDSRVSWSAITGIKQTKDLVLLYRGKNCFNIFTSALFASPQDWENFIGLAKSKIYQTGRE